jgi:hypothetical protein
VLGVCAATGLAAQTNDPRVTLQPMGGAAGVGETFAFSVAADGTEPLFYQWHYGSSPLASATNATLLLTNLTGGDAGTYVAVITNSLGSVTSSVAELFVVSTAPRVLWVQDVIAAGTSGVDVPLVLNANGRESAIQCSLQFDTNAFGSPTYQWEPGNEVTVVTSNLAQGELGLTFTRMSPDLFPAGEQTLGTIGFSLLGTNTTALDGRLMFADSPVSTLATDTNGLEMLLAASVVPRLQTAPVQPALNPQTGLFEQTVTLANPSGATFANLRVYVPSPGVDTSTNLMFLFDADGSALVDVDGDGVLENTDFLIIPTLPPGETDAVTNGFYVADHATQPVADYYLGIGGSPGVPAPATTVPLRISLAQWTASGMVIEWSTRPNTVYAVRCADSPVTLTDPDLAVTSTNTVPGTGSPARWLDPKPVESPRFYQVIESP